MSSLRYILCEGYDLALLTLGNPSSYSLSEVVAPHLRKPLSLSLSEILEGARKELLWFDEGEFLLSENPGVPPDGCSGEPLLIRLEGIEESNRNVWWSGTNPPELWGEESRKFAERLVLAHRFAEYFGLFWGNPEVGCLYRLWCSTGVPVGWQWQIITVSEAHTKLRKGVEESILTRDARNYSPFFDASAEEIRHSKDLPGGMVLSWSVSTSYDRWKVELRSPRGPFLADLFEDGSDPRRKHMAMKLLRDMDSLTVGMCEVSGTSKGDFEVYREAHSVSFGSPGSEISKEMCDMVADLVVHGLGPVVGSDFKAALIAEMVG